MKNTLNNTLVFFLCICFVLIFAGASQSAGKTGGSLGIYIYENIEGYHTVSSTAGTELTQALLPIFSKVMAFDRIPLQSNETVRILEEMTKERKVTVTLLSTWLNGGSISAPSVTFADDAIKFKDLTWHIDQDKVIADAKKQAMNHILVGSLTGFIKPVKSKTADTGGRLSSVAVIANLRLIDLTSSSVVWAETYREKQAGFDYRTDFDDLALRLSKRAGKEVLEFLSNQSAVKR